MKRPFERVPIVRVERSIAKQQRWESDLRKVLEGAMSSSPADFDAPDTLSGYAFENPKGFTDIFFEMLDLERGQDFHRTIRALDTLMEAFDSLAHRELDDEDVGIERDDRSSTFAASQIVAQRLVDFVASRKGNYLMHVIARDYAAEMQTFVPELDIPESWKLVSREEIAMRSPIFRARPLQYGYIRSDGSLGLSNPADYDTLTREIRRIEESIAMRTEGKDRDRSQESFVSLSGRSMGEDAMLQRLCEYEVVQGDGAIHSAEVLFSPQVRRALERDFGIPLEMLNGHEQQTFLGVLEKRSLDDIEPLRRLVGKYGITAARTFLAVSVDPAVEQEIISLGNPAKSDEQKIHQVFETFTELTDRIDSLGQYIRATFGKEDPELAREVSQKILMRARGVIGKAHAAAEKGSIDDVLREIEDTDADTRLFIDVCRSLRERGALDPKAIAGSEYLTIHGGEFKGTFRRIAEEMERIHSVQYGPEGARYSEDNPELYRALSDALREHIENPERLSRFHVFMHEGKLVGFFRLDEEREDERLVRLHLASVMGDPFFKGGSLIERLVEQALAEVSVSTHAECDPRSAITGKYLRMGFVAKEVTTEKGLTVFRIERDPEKLRPETERQIPVAKIHEHAKNGSTEGPDVQYRSCASARDIEDLLRAGWVLTHWEPKLNMRREAESYSARLRKAQA